MNETSKSKPHWGELERSILRGRGIDIGCGPDPVTSEARRFEIADGDANVITQHVSDTFDFVYASHCLEHMHAPRAALAEWWQLVKPGGHLFFTVPDEDLYEQGVFPSRFNADHKATFTISKPKSWSPVSVNVLDLALLLPGSRLIKIALQDQGYDRRLLRFGPDVGFARLANLAHRLLRAAYRRGFPPIAPLDRWLDRHHTVDQTRGPAALAQIQCIIRRDA